MKGYISRGKLLAGAVLSFSLLVTPLVSFAASSVTTQPLFAPDRGTCSTMTAADVVPYIYNGELNSFDLTVSNPNAVAVAGMVGDQAFGFQVVNRTVSSTGTKIHVDLPSTRVGAQTPVQVTFLYSQGTQVCLSVVNGVINNTSGTVFEPIPQETPKPTYSQGSYTKVPPVTITKPAPPKVDISTNGKGTKATSTPVDSKNKSGSSTSATNLGIMGALSSITQACSNGHASRLWIVLLVLYALFVLALLLQKPDVFGTRTNEWSSGLILVLFLGLLGFWYMAAPCRAGPWVPAVATLIACAGLIVLSRWGETA